MALRLYYEDAYCMEFDATVLRCIAGARGSTGVILDRTCFYPTSGGQPCDHGTLDSLPVHEVSEQDGDIVHWTPAVPVQGLLHGRVDWARRFDHMQQHTGQHILSQAFLELLGAHTVGFHLGAESSTIDLDRAALDVAQASDAEDLANKVVFSDRVVTAHFVEHNQLDSLSLRKAPSVERDIRIVEIEGFDRSPCGGTHCSRTGEVGPVAILRCEHRGQQTRVEFLCGWRALHDYHWKTSTINSLALTFSVKDTELAAAILRLAQEASANQREVRRVQEELIAAHAGALLAEAHSWNGVRVVRRAFCEREPQEVRRLAMLLGAGQMTIALLGTSGQQARLFFSRTSDVPDDMAALLKKTCAAVGASGGGQPHLAQGGGLPGDKLEEALDFAYQTLMAGRDETDA